MWYVVQVRTGTEESIRLQCSRMLSKTVLEDCFIPYYEEKKHIQGVWTIQKKILFPGYLFVITDQVDELHRQLKQIIGLTKLLASDNEIVPITPQERDFLLTFGGEEQIVRMSEGIIENSQVKILSGPLMGKEASIKKIDRHKRKAYLEVFMFGSMQRVEVGLEVVAKIM